MQAPSPRARFRPERLLPLFSSLSMLGIGFAACENLRQPSSAKTATQASASFALESPPQNPWISGDKELHISGACMSDSRIELNGAENMGTKCADSHFHFVVRRESEGSWDFTVRQVDFKTKTDQEIPLRWSRNGRLPATPTLTSPATPTVLNSADILAIAGSCADGCIVHLSGAESQQMPCSQGAFSFTVGRRVDGSYNFQIALEDSTTGASSAALAFSWTRDTSPPPAPTLSAPASNPWTSADNLLEIRGSCENGANVALTMPDGHAASGPCLNGAFQYSVEREADGNYSFSLNQADAAGNVSSTTQLLWIHDSTIPAAPERIAPASNPWSSNTRTLSLEGSCSSGLELRLSGDATQRAVCGGDGHFAFLLDPAADGAFHYSRLQVNPSTGRASAPLNFAWTRDTLAPPAPQLTAPPTNPYLSSGSSLVLSGNCESGATVGLSGADAQSTSCTNGVFSFSVSRADDGVSDFNLSQSDAAGNPSAVLSFSWKRDTSVPSTPSLLSPAGGSAFSNGNGLTLSGGCSDGDLVSLSGDEIQTQNCAAGAFSFTVSRSEDGLSQYSLSQTNPLTGLSSGAVNVQWTRDTQAPPAPLIVSPAAASTSSSGTLVINGSCESGATVLLSGDENQQSPCPLTNAFAFSISKTSDGNYSFELRQSDRAGNVSAPAQRQWTRDTQAPPTPALLSPAAALVVSNSGTLSLTGSCQTGLSVILGGDLTASDVQEPASSLQAVCAASSFTFTLSKELDATYTLTLKQRDLAGNLSGPLSLQWRRDTRAPVVGIASAPPGSGMSRSASFSFSADETPASFECGLDGGSFAACSSPASYSGLHSGTHSFQLRARDSAGNLSATATYAWTVEAYDTIALYHLDALSPLADSSLFTGTRNNALNSLIGTNAITARFGEGRQFTTASSLMSAPDSSSLDAIADKFTAELNFKLDSLPKGSSYISLLSQSGSSGALSWEIRLKKSGGAHLLLFEGSTNGNLFSEISSAAIYPGTTDWHHLAVTFDSGSVKIFYDGGLVGSGTVGVAGSASLFNSSAPLRLCQDASGSRACNARIDEVRLSQIVRYHSNFTPPAAAFTAD